MPFLQGCAEHAKQAVVFHGQRGLTHLSLLRLLYRDHIAAWAAADEASEAAEPSLFNALARSAAAAVAVAPTAARSPVAQPPVAP